MYPVAVDVRHGVHLSAVLLESALLARVETPDAHKRDLLGRHLGEYAANFGQLLHAEAQQGGQRHTMDIAGRRSFRGIEIAMRVYPEDSQFLLLSLRPRSDAGHSADGDRMIASEHQGKVASLHDVLDLTGQNGRHARDLSQISGPLIADLQLLHVLDNEVAVIHDLVAELTQAICDPRDADGGWPHINSAASGAEIHRHAKYVHDHRDVRDRGFQRTCRRGTRPRPSSGTPSRSRSSRCTSSPPGVARGLICPPAFTTRCQGTNVPPGRAWSAYPTWRA